MDSGVRLCFSEVANAGDLTAQKAASLAGYVPASADLLREGVQLDCRIWNFIRSGGTETGNGGPDFMAMLPKPRITSKNALDGDAAPNKNNMLIPEELRKEVPKKENYYKPSWESEGDLTVTVNDGTFRQTRRADRVLDSTDTI